MSRISHHGAARRSVLHTERTAREGGYVLATFGLLLVPLLLMVGLSVDVGFWYNRTSQLQKAADAAALAGVVWLPDLGSATARAREAAARNGFTDGVNGVTVTVAAVPGENRRLRVTVTDPQVKGFIHGALTGKSLRLSRKATAEYVLPVPLGSPSNQFGGGPASDPSATSWPNLWGNIHGPRTDNNKGDAYAPACRGSDNCSGTSNPSYRPEGYLYTIDVGTGVSQLNVQVFDAGLYPRSAEKVETGDTAYTGTGSTTTTWTFYDKDSTELDTTDNPTAQSSGFCANSTPKGTVSINQNADADTYKNKWVSICKRNGTIAPGRYLLRVQTSGNGSSANRYAIRVLSSSTAKARIAGYGDMSMYNNVEAGNATFYLAEVDPIHRGKTLELKLYDPGEVTKTSSTSGNGTVKIPRPDGQVAASCSAFATAGTISPTLTPCQFQSASGGNALFNGAWVTIQIPIPATAAGYSCTMGTVPGCWWRIQYDIAGLGNDTTTWAAQVIGDPVHLVEEES